MIYLKIIKFHNYFFFKLKFYLKIYIYIKLDKKIIIIYFLNLN